MNFVFSLLNIMVKFVNNITTSLLKGQTDMKKIDIALFIGLIFTIFISSANAFAKNLDGISDSVVRLHILANSDSKEDQALKLKVRDAILKETAEIFTQGETRGEAEQLIVDNIDKIQEIAERTVEENGYSYPVKCELKYMEFNDRTYDCITLPAGYYDALRITIGEANGKNWWCVMYPQFCIAPSIKSSELKTFEKSEVKIMEAPKKYKVRFKCVDWYKKVKRFF